MSAPIGRVVALVDGFNVYYAIKNDPRLAGFKWLDYRKLCASILPRAATLGDVFYFTALFRRDQGAVARHRTYIRALRAVDVQPVFGKFKGRDRKCPYCNRWFAMPEEKQTDVNIAVRLCLEAGNDSFDTALLVTGDTDLLPVVNAMHDQFPGKRVGVFIPPHRGSKELVDAAAFHVRMKHRHLATCQLPDEVVLRDGSTVKRPASW